MEHGGCFKENLNAPPAGIGLSALKSRQRQETCEHSHMHPKPRHLTVSLVLYTQKVVTYTSDNKQYQE